MTEPDRALTTLTSPALSAEIDPMGAQLHALRDAQGRDLLWNGDPKFWTGRAPLLFPIVGALAHDAYRLDGAQFHLAKHGFARRQLFSRIEAARSAAVFRLCAQEETKAQYPFQFQLDVSFALAAERLDVAAKIINLDAASLPVSIGFHPAFRWPLPYGSARADHFIRFEQTENAPIRRINAAGLVKKQTYPTPVLGAELALRDDLFVDDALIFDRIASRELCYGAPGGAHLEIKFPDAAYLGVWTKPGADFICIEPWRGIADPEGFAGDFREKPGIFEIAPGASSELTMSITWRPEALGRAGARGVAAKMPEK